MNTNKKRTVTVCVDDLAKAIGESIMATLRANGFDKVIEASLGRGVSTPTTMEAVERELGNNVAQIVCCLDVTDMDDEFDMSDAGAAS